MPKFLFSSNFCSLFGRQYSSACEPGLFKGSLDQYFNSYRAFSESSLVFDDPSLFNKVATESRDFLRTLTPLLEIVLSKPFECF